MPCSRGRPLGLQQWARAKGQSQKEIGPCTIRQCPTTPRWSFLLWAWGLRLRFWGFSPIFSFFDGQTTQQIGSIKQRISGSGASAFHPKRQHDPRRTRPIDPITACEAIRGALGLPEPAGRLRRPSRTHQHTAPNRGQAGQRRRVARFQRSLPRRPPGLGYPSTLEVPRRLAPSQRCPPVYVMR